ncbi:hypothetical protein QBC46DRAFT_433420 [Diplogelasinospora grovesii]|uniref:Nephrocystin 3-like N-terminal domain-containing protein n=1 Tax=Diplogelasinospora grovesii TaxID=303347 RepID=A0AAN6NGA4_9PEZI|nr:hypothetical protein QBC46DRAFT_433420 [Diplogelasinospora grovesii]
MDRLSVAASVAGLISLSIQVTKSLVNFYSACKSQESDTLYNKLTNRTFRADEQDMLKTAEGSIQVYEDCINELQSETAYTLQKLDENINETVSHLSLALLVLHQKSVGRVQYDIEHTKALLNLVRADQLNGFAGCGKSVLCSTAIQFAFRHRRSNPRIGIGFFFFTFNNASKQDTSAMLYTLVLQLSCQLNDNHKLLSRLHDSYRNATPLKPARMDSFNDVYIILDTLNESARDKHRAGALQALPSLHLLITSRDEPNIRDELDVSQDLTISMKNTSVDSDITAFISGHLKKNRRLRK